MNTALKTSSWAIVLSCAAGLAPAQQSVTPAAAPAPAAATPSPASKSSAQIDAGEPRANVQSSAAGGPAATAEPPAAGRTASKNAAAPRGQGGERGAAPTVAGQKGPGAADRLNLNTATVTGDKEQPKVMYIVPWKSSNIGDLSGKPMNSLLDEALAPVDRDEFKREVAYYNAVRADTSQNGASGAAAKQGEK